MNKLDRNRIRELCALIAVEHDQQTLLELVRELNQLLGADQASLTEDFDDPLPSD